MDLKDLRFEKGFDKEADCYVTSVTNYLCDECKGTLNLREGYSFYPRKGKILCARCSKRHHGGRRKPYSGPPKQTVGGGPSGTLPRYENTNWDGCWDDGIKALES